LRSIALRRERRENFFGMRTVAGLDRDVEPGALGRNIEQQPLVLHLENIGAELAQAARDVAEVFSPTRRGFVASLSVRAYML